MPRTLLRRVWVATIAAALLGGAGGVIAGRADAEDAAQVRGATAERPASADSEDCNNAIPEDVIAALDEMAEAEEPVAIGLGDRDDGDDARRSPRATSAERAGDDAWVANSTTAVIETPLPNAWLPRGRRCGRRRGRTVCDGPRRVPAPHGEAAELAARLAIGDRRTASRILLEPPDPTWVAEVHGRPSETLLWPVPAGRLWRGFGHVRQGRSRRRLHKGLDIGAPEGSPIRSVNDGLVIYANNEVTGYGNLMMVLHQDGTVAFYAHCQRLYLFAGQRVRRGQLIGAVGHTGLAHGDHLHFELRVRGRPRNPLRRIVGRGDVPRSPATEGTDS